MPVLKRRAIIGPVVLLLLLAACTSASPSASTPASEQASTAPSQAESVAPSTAPGPDLSSELVNAGFLTVCIDIPYPPQEFFDADGNPTGADPDLAAEFAKRFGLKVRIENSIFDTIIAALTSPKCDLIISAQNINPERLGQVNMIPYFKAGQSFVVAKGNPKGVHTELDLCGLKVAAETGTTEVDYVNGTSDYAGDGLSKKCTDAGKAAVTMQEFQKDTDALLALASNTVDAYFADSPVAGYYVVNQPGQFELSGVTVEEAIEGISVTKDHSKLANAVVDALKAMLADGTYAQILGRYGLEDGGVTADQVEIQTGS